jgi:Domain of unknown function (DUF1905)
MGSIFDIPPPPKAGSFRGKLFVSSEGKGAWTFVRVPREIAPAATGAWGMVPVSAEIDGRPWDTTIWHTQTGEAWMPVPKKVRGKLQAGDEADFTVRPR